MCVFQLMRLCLCFSFVLQPHSKADAAELINKVFTSLYNAPLWIPARQAKRIVSDWEGFLILQQALVVQAHNEGQLLFLCKPKAHMIIHTVKTMMWECDISSHVLNPMAFGTQQDEDAVGKVCRLVRRVSPKLAVQRGFQRYLVSAYVAWSREGMFRRI